MKSRMRRSGNEPELFEGIHFYFYGDFIRPTLTDLITLALEGGGRIISEASQLSTLCTKMTRRSPSITTVAFKRQVIVICDQCQINFEKDAGISRNSDHLPLPNGSWIVQVQ